MKKQHVSQVATLFSAVLVSTFLTGCIDPSMIAPKEAAKTEEPAPLAPAANAAPAAAPGPAAGEAGLAKDNTKLVDKKQALAENPNLIVTTNRIDASDPVSAAAQSYFAIGSRAQLYNLKHQIDILKADNNNKPPSFAQFNDLLRQNNVKLAGLYRWQIYAYDDETGDIVILEDHAMKKAEYEKGGLKLD